MMLLSLCNCLGVCVLSHSFFLLRAPRPHSHSQASRGLMLTLGYVLCAALFVYPGTLNLEENIVFQYWSFATLIVLSAFFVVVFLSQSDFDPSRVPAV